MLCLTYNTGEVATYLALILIKNNEFSKAFFDQKDGTKKIKKDIEADG